MVLLSWMSYRAVVKVKWSNTRRYMQITIYLQYIDTWETSEHCQMQKRPRRTKIEKKACFISGLIGNACLIIGTSANISGKWQESEEQWEWGEFTSGNPHWEIFLALRSTAGATSCSIPHLFKSDLWLEQGWGVPVRPAGGRGQQLGSILILLLSGSNGHRKLSQVCMEVSLEEAASHREGMAVKASPCTPPPTVWARRYLQAGI